MQVSVKSIYGTPAMVHASLYLLGILLVAVNYALMYPVQSMVLLLTWQLAKYIVWFCSPSPASQSKYSNRKVIKCIFAGCRGFDQIENFIYFDFREFCSPNDSLSLSHLLSSSLRFTSSALNIIEP